VREANNISSITDPTAPVPSWIPFRIDELFPFKGYWFSIFEIREDRLKLRQHGEQTAPRSGWAPIQEKDLIRHKGFMFAVAELNDDHIVIVPLNRIRRPAPAKGRFRI
jgi:hypothetical protein